MSTDVQSQASSDPSVATSTETTATPDRSMETTAAGIPWVAFHQHRVNLRDRFPDHWSLPVDRTIFGSLDRCGVTPEIGSVLDVGATDRRHRHALRDAAPGIEYRSLDVDRTLPHDYHDFNEVDRQFDLVVCLEVLEHVDEATAISIARSCAEFCKPGGHVLFSVPNLLIPYVNHEFTHRTSFGHLDLGALCGVAGLEVLDIARGTRGSWRMSHRVHRMINRWHRFMRTDWPTSVSCLARRPETGANTIIEPAAA